MTPSDDLGSFSMEQLFEMEADTQCAALSDALVALEATPGSQELLTTLMRAAHSLKGAARIIGNDPAVKVAHAMEDCFVLAQKGALVFTAATIDLMLRGVDLLRKLAAGAPEAAAGVPAFVEECAHAENATTAPTPPLPSAHTAPEIEKPDIHQLLRVDAGKIDRLLGFAGEGLVSARQLEGFLADLQRLGQQARATASRLQSINGDERLHECRLELAALQTSLLDRHTALDTFSRRWNLQAERLYEEALSCRMLPLADILPGLRRLVRDLSREMGKSVALEIMGAETPVDREILEQLEAPLSHLLRNALDHGLESPEERAAAGKPEQGKLVIEARHVGGHLAVTVSDDGRGVDAAVLRRRIVERHLAAAETVATMTELELIEFLFLPGFSMRDTVTEISGRGVGLDIVQSMARSVRGAVRAVIRPGQGLAFELRLPISLSVLRSLLVRIADEAYAFPLAHIDRAIRLPIESIESAEGRQFFVHGGTRIPLALASQILSLGGSEPAAESVCVLLVAHQGKVYGVIVEEFLGEQELVVQALDPALGRVPGISSASLMTDGTPLLIVDVDDFVVAMERLAAEGTTQPVQSEARAGATHKRRILVVEDSLTVRELERKLLRDRGYDVTVAVDGMDGWTALRGGNFDLVLTDVDMPRMDGIELTRLIKADPRLRDTPVMIVSYKDREEDRLRGLDAGADYYLAKGNFQDRTLISAVLDLIGEPDGMRPGGTPP